MLAWPKASANSFDDSRSPESVADQRVPYSVAPRASHLPPSSQHWPGTGLARSLKLELIQERALLAAWDTTKERCLQLHRAPYHRTSASSANAKVGALIYIQKSSEFSTFLVSRASSQAVEGSLDSSAPVPVRVRVFASTAQVCNSFDWHFVPRCAWWCALRRADLGFSGAL